MRLRKIIFLKDQSSESIATMLSSEVVLHKDWDNEADEKWNDV